jgi:glutathione-independent formaldehyde dehydrogenase
VGKGLQLANGQTPVKSYHVCLRDLIIAGKANPGAIVTDHINIKDAPDTYKTFDKRDGLIKAAIRFV